jgi:plastocyanin
VSPLLTSIGFTALTLAVAACAGTAARTAAPADPAAAEVTVVAEDVHFVDPPTRLSAGTFVLAVDNRGEAPHDVTVEGVDDAVVGAVGGQVAAGEVTLEPGTYTVYCSVGNHRGAGMVFDLEVE